MRQLTTHHFTKWLLILAMASSAGAGEMLPNGIRLPEDWPPQGRILTREPLATPPYLLAPPKVTTINVGRQLFVDDFLIEKTTLTRSHHLPEYHEASPVLAPDQPWELQSGVPHAAVFSDGVWYDPKDELFKMWYWAGLRNPDGYSTCYATSRDGVVWDKPSLDIVPGTNIVVQDEPDLPRNSTTVWLDLNDEDPQRRYKMFRVISRRTVEGDQPRVARWMRVSFSPDGIQWRQAADSDLCADRSTVFFNPFRNVWVFSLRGGAPGLSRARLYHEHGNLLEGLRWSNKPVLWVGADRLDPDRSDLELVRSPEAPWDLVPSQLYNLDAVAYESVLLGLFSIWRGQPPSRVRPKINEVCVGYSRDGFHWSRPDRRAFCPVSENKDDWNWGNVQSAGGGCLVVGDKLYFYAGGVSGRMGRFYPDATDVGLAVLRRDGFTSMDAGDEQGELTTRPVHFDGRHLFVNVDAPEGTLLAEVLDDKGNPIEPFTRDRCRPIQSDSTLHPVTWEGADDLSSVAGKPVRLRFHLNQGRLYAFWVSPGTSGASHGYVGAGGPGFTGSTDNVGRAAYDAAAKLRP